MDSRLDELRQALEAAVDGMSSEQLSWHLPDKWSAAEVLEHLYMTYVGTTRGLEKVIARGTPLATRPSLEQRMLTLVVVGLGYMPAGREAPPIVRPKGLPVEHVRAEIGLRLAAMDTIITRCETRFGPHVKLLDHPIVGALAAPQWRTLHVVHGWHHHKQLLRLRTLARTSRDGAQNRQ